MAAQSVGGLVPRRRVLAGLLALPGLTVLAACSGEAAPGPSPSTSSGSPASTSTTPSPPTTPAPDPDEPALSTAATAAAILASGIAATASTHPTLRDRLSRPQADHEAHARLLRELGAAPTGAPPPAPVVPVDPAQALAVLVQAEQVAGDEAEVAAVGARSGEVARVLASVAASRAVHAVLLGRAA